RLPPSRDDSCHTRQPTSSTSVGLCGGSSLRQIDYKIRPTNEMIMRELEKLPCLLLSAIEEPSSKPIVVDTDRRFADNLRVGPEHQPGEREVRSVLDRSQPLTGKRAASRHAQNVPDAARFLVDDMAILPAKAQPPAIKVRKEYASRTDIARFR